MDDERGFIICLTRLFQIQNDYEVFTALSGVEALEILERKKVDIAITDIKMPEMSGVELLCKIKSKYPHIEVIILTAFGSIESAVLCMKKGAFDYMRKPFCNDELYQTIERCIQHIDLKKESPFKAENIELKRKVDFFSKEFDNLKQLSQERIIEHPESMTLSEVGDLIAGITHSLTTEIGIINSTSESLLAEKTKDGTNIKKYERLLRSAKYCNALLNNLRSVLLEAKPAPTEVDIKEVLYDVITLFEYRIPSNVKLIKEISPKLPKLIVDKSQIELALMNTINNAIESMPEGGKLSIRAKKKKTNLLIEISDTGVGIPKENLKNVFKLYFSTKKKGYGLGLYVTKSIVERHNGSISLKSQEGKGTTITISLPIGEES